MVQVKEAEGIMGELLSDHGEVNLIHLLQVNGVAPEQFLTLQANQGNGAA